MDLIQGLLILISVFWVIVAVLFVIKRFKRNDASLGDLASFIGASFTPIALIWAVYGQISQTKIIENQIKNLSPYFSISIHHNSFEYYKDHLEFFYDTQPEKTEPKEKEFYKNEKEVTEKYYKKNPKEEYISANDPDLKKEDVEKQISNFFKSPFFEKIIKEEYENSILKNGSQVLEIEIKNLGQKFDIIEVKNEDLFIDNSPDTDFKKTSDGAIITYRIPINFFWENEKPIVFSIRGRDNQSKFRKYKITIKTNEKERELIKKEKLSMVGKLRFEDKLNLSRASINELTSEIDEL